MSRSDRSVYRESNREYYRKNREKSLAASKNYYRKNKDKAKQRALLRRTETPEKHIWSAAKYRAKSFGLAFDISIEDIRIPQFCPVLGIELGPLGGNGRNDNAPSIDRINNSKGYIRGNVIIISHRANCLKRDATLLEMQRMADFYTKLSLTSREQVL